jgi:hypothetical protein
MSDIKDDGGPAFPSPPIGTGDPRDGMSGGCFGMSLRDHFAEHAPASEIDNRTSNSIGECAEYLGIPFSEYDYRTHYFQVLAKARYEWADAMLQARKS